MKKEQKSSIRNIPITKKLLVATIVFVIVFLFNWLWPIQTTNEFGQLITESLKKHMDGISLWTSNSLIIHSLNYSQYGGVFPAAKVFSILATISFIVWFILMVVEYNNTLRNKTKNIDSKKIDIE